MPESIGRPHPAAVGDRAVGAAMSRVVAALVGRPVRLLAGLALLVVLAAAARSTVFRRGDDPTAGVIDLGPAAEPAAAVGAAGRDPSLDAPPVYRELEDNGAAGGEIAFAVPGRPADVLAMLLDFANEGGNRPWRTACRVLSHNGDRWEVEAAFDGSAGVNPVVVLVHQVLPDGDGFLVRFHLERGAFGLRRFDGEYEIRPAGPAHCRLRQRVFIHSGLPLLNASAADVRDGLVEDAKMIRAWMQRRLGG
jgi:hypothetical protein